MRAGLGNDFSLKDLMLARRDARRFRNAHPDLRDYHAGRADALGRAFGLEPGKTRGDRGLLSLLEATESQLDAVASPFERFLEAPKSVVALHRRHGEAITACIDALGGALVDLLIDLVADILQLDRGTTVSETAVRDCGFDPARPAPDPYEYF
jgi:hypothetical protein